MMDQSSHSSISSMVSAITLDEAIRTNNRSKVNGHPSQRRVYKSFSGRSSGSISTIKMDEVKRMDMADPFNAHNNIDDEANDDMNCGLFHLSRFDIVCPRRGSDEILKPPRHDLFDDHVDDDYEGDDDDHDGDDDDDHEEERKGEEDEGDESDADSDVEMYTLDMDDRPVLSTSAPCSTRRWMMERPSMKKTLSADFAPVLPRSERTWRSSTPRCNTTDCPPVKPLSRDGNQYTDPFSVCRQGSVAVKRLTPINMPLRKPVRQESFGDNFKRGTHPSLEPAVPASRPVWTSTMPLSYLVRQKSGHLLQPSRPSSGKLPPATGQGPDGQKMPPRSESLGYYLAKSTSPKKVPSKASATGPFSNLAEDAKQTKTSAATLSVRRRKMRVSAFHGIRRRSLGPLGAVSFLVERTIPMENDGIPGKRCHFETILQLESSAEDDMMEGASCHSSFSKKFRRHSTPWFSSVTHQVGTTCEDRVEGSVLLTVPSFNTVDEPNMEPSPPPVHPPSPVKIEAVSGAAASSWTRQFNPVNSRFDPFAWKSGHSREMISLETVLMPPQRQKSNHGLAPANLQEEKEAMYAPRQSRRKAPLETGVRTPMSPHGIAPPRMPKRKSSFHDLDHAE